MPGQSIPTTKDQLSNELLDTLKEMVTLMGAEFRRRYHPMASEVRDLIEEGRLLWADGAQNMCEKAYANAAENFGKAALLTWSAAEQLASKSPQDARCLAAESLAFEGLATSMRGRAEVDPEHRNRLMQEAAGLVSTAKAAVEGRSSVAIGFAGAVSAGMLDAGNGRAAAQSSPNTASASGGVVAAWDSRRPFPTGVIGAAKNDAVAGLDRSSPGQRQPPRARAQTR